jgi:hypothetical protein
MVQPLINRAPMITLYQMEWRQSSLIFVSLKDSSPKSQNIFGKSQKKTHVLRVFGINSRQERVSTEPFYIYWFHAKMLRNTTII